MTIEKFLITLTKKRKINDILFGGKFDEVNFLVRDGIQRKRIIVQDETLGSRQITILSFDEAVDAQTVKLAAYRLRLLFAKYEDVFLFGEQYPEEQKKGPIVFLSDTPYLWSGHLFNFSLDMTRSGKRKISLVSSGGNFPMNQRFGFVDPK